MPFIITHPTDQHQAKYGYCSKCWTYNEVWRKDKESVCPQCDRVIHHISGWVVHTIITVLLILIFIFLYIVYYKYNIIF